MLGENGGAFFGAGSAHPFENPNGFTNLLQVLAMLAFPAGLIYTYGIYMGNSKQSWRVFWNGTTVRVLTTSHLCDRVDGGTDTRIFGAEDRSS